MDFINVNPEDRRQCYATESLALEAKEKNSDFYLNFAYTDYGGDFFDKVAIAYFKEKHPESIVYESTSFNGENAFIFGNIAKEFTEESSRYLLGFEDMEDFYYSMEAEIVAVSAADFYAWNEEMFIADKEEVISYITQYLEGCRIEPNYVDYNEDSLKEYLSDFGVLQMEVVV